MTRGESQRLNVPTIYIGKNGKKIQRKSKALYVDGSILAQSTIELLNALDQKYFYCGTFSDDNKDIVAKAELTGKMLEE
jgi:hypothetical protein